MCLLEYSKRVNEKVPRYACCPEMLAQLMIADALVFTLTITQKLHSLSFQQIVVQQCI